MPTPRLGFPNAPARDVRVTLTNWLVERQTLGDGVSDSATGVNNELGSSELVGSSLTELTVRVASWRYVGRCEGVQRAAGRLPGFLVDGHVVVEGVRRVGRGRVVVVVVYERERVRMPACQADRRLV